MSKAENTKRLKAINKAAKELRKANPKLSWREALKKAGAKVKQ